MKKPTSSAVFCFFVLASFALLFAPPVRAQGSAPAYVGEDACKDCHDAQFGTYMKSIHAKKAVPGSPASSQACESCHGPGGDHVEKGGGKGVGGLTSFGPGESAEKKSAPCLACHGDTKALNFWDGGTHKAREVACTDCHTAHSGRRTLLKNPEPFLCLPCHKEVKNRINRQAHHPIIEGKVKCTDCHLPHGASGKYLLRADSVPDLCYKCHQEKRGPFAFEHPPVAENCITCHEPHGSNHNNLLQEKPPQLCQACHATGLGHTSRAYTVQSGFGGNATGNKNKFFAQGCLNCHGNIHGSNRSPQFLR
jgi:DmsE family decaheme c-type cytochrome